MATLPTRTLEIEFDAGVWTSVSADVVAISTARGRNRESGAFETGTMSFTVRNDTRKYDPDHTAGTYYGKLRPNRRVRLNATHSAITYPIYQGFIDRIVQQYGGPNDATALFDCSDMFKILNRVELPSSPYAAEISADAPQLWWRLGEAAGSTSALDESGNARTGTVQGAVTFGASSLTTHEPNGAASMTETAATAIGGSMPLNSTTPWAIEFWLRLPANPTVIQQVFYANAGSETVNNMSLQLNNATKTLGVVLVNDAGTTYTATPSAVLNANQTYHVVVTHNADRVLRIYLDGALSVSGATTAGTFAFTNFYIGSPTALAAPNATVDEVAVYASGASPAITTSRIGDHNTVGRTSWVGELSGARLDRVATLAGVPAGDRNINAGSTTLQATDLGGSALAYAQKIEETEAGRLFISRDGKLTFVSRYNADIGSYLTSKADLTDDDAGAVAPPTVAPYRMVTSDVDEATIVTRATVSRIGGVAVTYKDAAAITEFQIVDEGHDGLLHDNDTYSAAYAQWIVNTHRTPTPRVGTVTLELPKDPTNMYPAILALELGDRVTYNRKPQNTGAVITRDMRVEAIRHETGGHYWTTTLQLTPFNLGQSGYGTGVWDTSLWDQAVWGL